MAGESPIISAKRCRRRILFLQAEVLGLQVVDF